MAVVSSTTALSFESRNILHDASFSSYLNGDEQTLVLKLTNPNQNIKSLISIPHDHVYVGKKKIEDGEIGVFSAENYFKGAMDEGKSIIADKISTRYQHEKEKDEQVNSSPVKPRTQSGTPSARSVSSWNSQTALFQRNPRNQQQQRRKIIKLHNKSLLSSLACSCSCNDKNSVEIDHQHGEKSKAIPSNAEAEQAKKASNLVRRSKSLSKTWAEEETHCKKIDEMGDGLKREECFSFPILNSKPGGGDDVKRSSFEVFGSPILENGKKSSCYNRKVAMLNWDLVTQKKNEFLRSSNDIYNDTESDASSDLFEIESFSTNTNPFLARQTSNGISSSTTCYAPSEASIEWSVITASAADFTAMSDSDELRTRANPRNLNRVIKNDYKPTAGKEIHKRLPGVLLGCKSQKSVRVAEEVHKTSEKTISEAQLSHRLDPYKPLPRFQADTKLTGLGSRYGSQIILYKQ